MEVWERKLSLLSATLDEWQACQSSWLQLEHIFNAEDILKQLPAESQKFLVVDKTWKSIMTRTHADPSVSDVIATPNL
jgi:dynein heavy chain, axonemal